MTENVSFSAQSATEALVSSSFAHGQKTPDLPFQDVLAATPRVRQDTDAIRPGRNRDNSDTNAKPDDTEEPSRDRHANASDDSDEKSPEPAKPEPTKDAERALSQTADGPTRAEQDHNVSTKQQPLAESDVQPLSTPDNLTSDVKEPVITLESQPAAQAAEAPQVVSSEPQITPVPEAIADIAAPDLSLDEAVADTPATSATPSEPVGFTAVSTNAGTPVPVQAETSGQPTTQANGQPRQPGLPELQPDPAIEPEIAADGDGPVAPKSGAERGFGAAQAAAQSAGPTQANALQLATAASTLPPLSAQPNLLQQGAQPLAAAALDPALAGDGASVDIDLGDTSLSSRQQGSTTAGLTGKTAKGAAAANGTPLRMDAIALRINQAVRAGETRFQIQIDPPELGRIDVKLDIAKDGQIRASLTVDRPETLDLMQRDARALHKALEATGLKLENGALDFSMRDDGTGQSNTRDGASTPSTRDTEAERGNDPAILEPQVLAGTNLRAALGGVDRTI